MPAAKLPTCSGTNVDANVDVEANVDVALIGCPPHEGQGCIAAVAAVPGYQPVPELLSLSTSSSLGPVTPTIR